MKNFAIDDENLSPEEAKKLEDDIRNYYKRVDANKDVYDFSFDRDFDTAIESKYYEAEANLAVFTAMEYQLNNLYKYFQYTKRFVAAHERSANEYYHEAMKKAQSQEEAEALMEVAPNNDLTELICQSILIMAYSALEAFLRDIISVVGDDKGVLRYPPKEGFSAMKYINYLNKKDIFVPKVLHRQFDEIRLIRNYFAHSLEKVQENLSRYLKNDKYSILQGERIVLNHKYVEYSFDIFGRLVKSVERAYIENYE